MRVKIPVKIIGATLFCIGVWYLGSPLLIDDVVEEDFPMVIQREEEEPDPTEQKKVEELREEDVEKMTEKEKKEAMEEMQKIGEKMPDQVTEDPMPPVPSGPVQLAQGSFQDADTSHKGSGTATLYALEDGSNILRFEDFSVTNGPALSVFLTNSADGSMSENAVNLGKLKGNKGSQNYSIDASIDLDEYSGVLIYCVPFKVPFAFSALQ